MISVARHRQRAPRLGICALGIDGGRSGIGHYTHAVVRELGARTTDWQVDLVGQPSDLPLFDPFPADWRWIEVPEIVTGPLREILWMQIGLATIARRRSWDIAFIPAGNRRLPWWCPCPTVGTVHDFSSLHVAGKYDAFRALYISRLLPRLVRRLDRVISVSRASARDIVGFARVDAERVDVIPNGVEPRNPGDPNAARRSIRESCGVTEPWIVYVSRLEHPGKNHVRLIRGFETLLAMEPELPHRLILVGADWSGSDTIHEAIATSPMRQRITTTGFVDRARLDDLLTGAELLAFPSLYEGFGLPVLEAMAAGVPVVCSETSSLPEVGGDAALYFDPEDPSAIADAMRRALGQPAVRRRMIRRGLQRARDFSWSKTAERTLHSIAETMETAS